MSDQRRAKLLALLETTDTWLMASSAAQKAGVYDRTARAIINELVAEGVVVSRPNSRGIEYALESRQHVVSRFVPNLDRFNEVMKSNVDKRRAKRADAVEAVLMKRQSWTSLKSIRMECAMSDLCGNDAVADLVKAGRAVAKTVRLGPKAEITYYALPETAKRIEEAEAEAARAAMAVVVTVEEPKRKAPQKLTFGGAQLRLVERYAERLKDGEELDTTELALAAVNAAQLKNVYQTGKAHDLADEVLRKAEARLGWESR